MLQIAFQTEWKSVTEEAPAASSSSSSSSSAAAKDDKDDTSEKEPDDRSDADGMTRDEEIRKRMRKRGPGD